MTWDQHFHGMCVTGLEKSKDQSTKVFCIITDQEHGILSTGYNDFPRGVVDKFIGETDLILDNGTRIPQQSLVRQKKEIEDRRQRPAKYRWTEHAERNAIYNAARNGIRLKGGILYCVSKPKEFPPCCDCARGIIQSGIIEVVFNYDEIPEQWKESCEVTFTMFNEAGIKYRKFVL